MDICSNYHTKQTLGVCIPLNPTAMPRTSFGVTPWEWRRDRHLTSRTHLIILLGHQLAQLALVAITKLWQARIGVGIFVAIGSLLGLLRSRLPQRYFQRAAILLPAATAAFDTF